MLDLDILIIVVCDYRRLHYLIQVPPVKAIRVRKIIIIAVLVRKDALSILDFFRSFCFIIINEFSRECLVIRVKKAQLYPRDKYTDGPIRRSRCARIRSDNGPKFIVKLSDYGSRALAQSPP